MQNQKRLPADEFVRHQLGALQPNPKRQNREAMKRFEPEILAAFKRGAMPRDVFDTLTRLGYAPAMSTLNRLFKNSKANAD